MKKLFTILLVLSFHFSVCAQTTDVPQLNLNFTAIVVMDIDSSIEWYSTVFGYEVKNRVDNPDYGFSQANLKNGDIHLELIEINKTISVEELLKDQPPKSKVSGFFKIGFTVNDFDKWIENFRKNNVIIHGRVVTDKATGKRMVIVLDPDGNRVQLFEN